MDGKVDWYTLMHIAENNKISDVVSENTPESTTLPKKHHATSPALHAKKNIIIWRGPLNIQHFLTSIYVRLDFLYFSENITLVQTDIRSLESSTNFRKPDIK